MASEKDANLMLYPDLMSEEELISVLKQRYVQADKLKSMDKYELVDLYNQFILPLPQRKYRRNRRGRDMTKKQIIASKARKRSSTDNTDSQPETKRKSNGGLLTSFEVPSAGGDRLKPPPSCIDTNKKTIKLGSSSNSIITSPSLGKHKLVSNNTNSVTDSIKKIKLKDSSSTTVTQSSDDVKKDIDSNNAMETEISTEKEDASKKKIKKISWP